jgi:hypothetical protein
VNPVRTLTAAGLLALGAGFATAQGISGLAASNRSSPAVSFAGISSGGQLANAFEFNSSHALGAPRMAGDTADFTMHMGWFAGLRYGPGMGNSAVSPTPREANLEYGLSFRVDDPQRQGYTLKIESFMQGVLHGMASSLGSTGTAYLPRLDVTLDMGGTYFGPLSYTLDGAEQTNTAAQRVVRRESLQTTEFFGDRDFTLRITTPVDSIADGGFGPLPPEVEAYALFGLLPSRNELAAGAGLVPAGAGDLGHFLTVTAHFSEALAPVPEPATWASLALGVAALLWRRRVRPTF